MALIYIPVYPSVAHLYAQPPSLAVCAQQCHAQCCRAPGFVRMDTEEMRRLKRLNPAVKVVHDGKGAAGDDLWLMEFSARVGACLFLNQQTNLCTIYAQRPDGCAHYPTRPDAQCLVWPEVQP